MDSIECIPSDPDISGIGVRVAIYAQNLLSFIPAILALWDGEVSLDELKAVEKQSTTILITAFAILISAMVQAWTHQLSNFHASIILNLSWMNNTNTFIYLLLYIQHRSQPGPAQISMDVRSWLIHIAMELDSLYHVLPWWDDSDIPIREILKRIVYVLGAFHLALMAAFGIWLWSSPRSFGSANMCAIDNASTFILGNRVPLHSDALRAWSIAIYSLFLLPPGLNLFLPLTLFLGLFLTYQARRQRLDPTNGQRGPTFSARTNPPVHSSQLHYSFPSITPIFVGLAILFVINVIFLVDIELTLQQIRSTDESSWTFGQTLALLLLVLPLHDLVEMRFDRLEEARQEELARREKAHNNDIVRHETARRTEKNASLLDALRRNADLDTLWELVKSGADVNVVADDYEYPTALHLASSRGDMVSVSLLMARGADPNIQGGKYATALQAASVAENTGKDVLKLLLEGGADPNTLGGKYGTALQAAAHIGDAAKVQLLLEYKAGPNIVGGEYGTALRSAVHNADSDIVALLLSNNADPNIQGGKYGTALQVAWQYNHHKIIQILVQHGADTSGIDNFRMSPYSE